jgi:hypothetical protein
VGFSSATGHNIAKALVMLSPLLRRFSCSVRRIAGLLHVKKHPGLLNRRRFRRAPTKALLGAGKSRPRNERSLISGDNQHSMGKVNQLGK